MNRKSFIKTLVAGIAVAPVAVKAVLTDAPKIGIDWARGSDIKFMSVWRGNELYDSYPIEIVQNYFTLDELTESERNIVFESMSEKRLSTRLKK